MKYRSFRFGSLVASLVFATGVPASGSTLIAAEYGDFVNPFVGNVGDPDNLGVRSVAAGPITITPLNPGRTRGGFGVNNPIFGTNPFPGDIEGFISYNGGNIPASDRDEVVLTFSEPVAGFGVTFFHSVIQFFGDPTGVSLPSTIQVFSGEAGSGQLLGKVQSSGLPEDVRQVRDFVGLLSDQRIIRSAVLTGPDPFHGFAVDAYAVTLTPIPEPSSLFLAALIGVPLMMRRQ